MNKRIGVGRYLRPMLIMCLATILVVLMGAIWQSGSSFSSAPASPEEASAATDVVRNNILTGYQFGILCRQENMKPANRSRYHLCEAFYRQNFDRSAEAVIYLRAWFEDQARLIQVAAQKDLMISVAFLALAVVMAACFVCISVWTPASRMNFLSGSGFVLWAVVILFALYSSYDHSDRQAERMATADGILALKEEMDARALSLAAEGHRTVSTEILQGFIDRYYGSYGGEMRRALDAPQLTLN
ncbi:MAG: hypothetical protein ABJN26_12150 [Stappiaceae bacterium]